MSVYTEVSETVLRELLADYSIGDLEGHRAITAGITNTNYFVDTTVGRWVLTLFEQMDADALPFFMQLMDHLAGHGVPGAHPVARDDGGFLSRLCGRPAALVYRLSGASVETPGTAHCAALGSVVADMHRAVRTFAAVQPNPRDLDWIDAAAGRLDRCLDRATRALLADEIAYQRDAAQRVFPGLPRGVIHADMFRDNVLFEDARVSGVIDFYYACEEYLLYELAVICNDWALDDAMHYAGPHWQAFAVAYHRRRALTAAEQAAWPAMLRVTALRYWVSRLIDHHFPMTGHIIQPHDPKPFEQRLRRHREGVPPLIDPALVA